MNKVVLLCRPGFYEKRVRCRSTDKAGKRELFGFARVKGARRRYVIYECYQPEDGGWRFQSCRSVR